MIYLLVAAVFAAKSFLKTNTVSTYYDVQPNRQEAARNRQHIKYFERSRSKAVYNGGIDYTIKERRKIKEETDGMRICRTYAIIITTTLHDTSNYYLEVEKCTEHTESSFFKKIMKRIKKIFYQQESPMKVKPLTMEVKTAIKCQNIESIEKDADKRGLLIIHKNKSKIPIGFQSRTTLLAKCTKKEVEELREGDEEEEEVFQILKEGIV
jgi:hypothetical protein